MLTRQQASRAAVRSLRVLSRRTPFAVASSSRCFASSSRVMAEEQPEALAKSPVSPKIAPIVDQISGLTLLEVSELVTALKVGLPIPLHRSQGRMGRRCHA